MILIKLVTVKNSWMILIKLYFITSAQQDTTNVDLVLAIRDRRPWWFSVQRTLHGVHQSQNSRHWSNQAVPSEAVSQP